MQEYTVKVYDNHTEWYQNNKLHREDGPAKEWGSGTKEWFQNDRRHRLDGPAIEGANGYKEYWIDGKYYTEQQFNEKTNPTKKEMTVAEIEAALGYSVKIVKG